MGRLDGKVAIVTGAAWGLGRATAELYAAEGARVVLGDIDAESAEGVAASIRAAGGEAVAVATDVSRGEDVRALVSAAEERYGALHLMTANAGGGVGSGHMKSLVDMTEQEFDEIMGVNFGGVMRCFKYAIPAILRSGGGAMTATTSLAAQMGYARLPAYCAAKGAISALVRSLAVEFGEHIRVNAVAGGGGRQSHARVAAGAVVERMGPVRLNDASEVAHAHLWLVSDDSSYVNGHVLVADAGLTVIPPGFNPSTGWYESSG